MQRVRSKKKAIWIVLGAIFVAALSLVLLLVLRKDYAGAYERVQGMLAVEKQVKKMAGATEITEKNIEKVKEGLAAIGALESECKKLGRSSALKDEGVKSTYKTIEIKVEKWVELSEMGMTLVKIIEGDGHKGLDKLIKNLKETDNKKFKEMAKELKEYQGKVENFKKTYNSGKTSDYVKMQEEYGKIVAEGEEIKAKYEEMEFKKYVGMSEKKMIGLFDDLRKLENYLKEKM